MRPSKRSGFGAATAAPERETKRRQPSSSTAVAQLATGSSQTAVGVGASHAPAALGHHPAAPMPAFTHGRSTVKSDTQAARAKPRSQRSMASTRSLLRRHMATNIVSASTQTQGPAMTISQAPAAAAAPQSYLATQQISALNASNGPIDMESDTSGPSSSVAAATHDTAHPPPGRDAQMHASTSDADHTASDSSKEYRPGLHAPIATRHADSAGPSARQHAQAEATQAPVPPRLGATAKREVPGARRHTTWGSAVRVPAPGNAPPPRWSTGTANRALVKRPVASDPPSTTVVKRVAEPGKAPTAAPVPHAKMSAAVQGVVTKKVASGSSSFRAPARPSASAESGKGMSRTRLMGSKRRASTSENDPHASGMEHVTHEQETYTQKRPVTSAELSRPSSSAAAKSTAKPDPWLQAATEPSAPASAVPSTQARTAHEPVSTPQQPSPASHQPTRIGSDDHGPAGGMSETSNQLRSTSPLQSASAASATKRRRSTASHDRYKAASSPQPLQPSSIMNSRSLMGNQAGTQSPRRHVHPGASYVSQHDIGMPDAKISTSAGPSSSGAETAGVGSPVAAAVVPMAVGLTRPTRSSSARAQSKRSASSNRSMSHGSRRTTSIGTQQASAANYGQSATSHSTQSNGRDGKDRPWRFSTSTNSRPPAAGGQVARSVQPKQPAAEVNAASRLADEGTATMDSVASAPASEAMSLSKPLQPSNHAEPANAAALPPSTNQPLLSVAHETMGTVVICPTGRGSGDMPEPLGGGGMFASDVAMEISAESSITAESASSQTVGGLHFIESAEIPTASVQQLTVDGDGDNDSSMRQNTSTPIARADAMMLVAEHQPDLKPSVANMPEHPVQNQSTGAMLFASKAPMSLQQPAIVAENDAPEHQDMEAHSPDSTSPAAAAAEADALPTPAPMLYSNAAFLASPRGQVSPLPQRLTTTLEAPLVVASSRKGPSGWSLEDNHSSSRGSLDDAQSAFINPAFMDARGSEEGPGTPEAQALMRSPPGAVSMVQLLAPLDEPSSKTSAAEAAEVMREDRTERAVQASHDTQTCIEKSLDAQQPAAPPALMSPEPALSMTGAWPAASTPPGMPEELQTPAAEQLLMALQQQLPFASASARRLAASPLLKQMLRTQAPEPTPSTPFWDRDIEGPSDTSAAGTPSQVSPEPVQETASSQASATGTAAAGPGEAAAVPAVRTPASPSAQAADSSHPDAAASASAKSSPAGSSSSSPQSSFPGFQIPMQVDDAASSPHTNESAQQREASIREAQSQEAGPSTPMRQPGNAWGALFSPERSPVGSAIDAIAKGPTALQIRSETPAVQARGTPPPPPTGLQTPWDALFSSPGGLASPQAALATSHSSPAAAADPLLVSGQPLPALSSAPQSAPPEQATHEIPGRSGHGGGFVALLEASLTELAGPAQAPENTTAAAASSKGSANLQQTSPQAPAGPADALHQAATQQQNGGHEVMSMRPDSAADAVPTAHLSSTSPVQQGPEVAVNLRQSIPGPSISLDLVLAPADTQLRSAASPLDSEATLTMQPSSALQSELPLMGTPTWGWGLGETPQPSLQTSPAASHHGAGVRADTGGQVRGIDTVIPASPAESVGSATGPHERLQDATLPSSPNFGGFQLPGSQTAHSVQAFGAARPASMPASSSLPGLQHKDSPQSMSSGTPLYSGLSSTEAGSERAESEQVPTPVFRGFDSSPGDLDASLGTLDAASPASWLSGSRLSSQDSGDVSSALAPSPIAYPSYSSGVSADTSARPSSLPDISEDEPLSPGLASQLSQTLVSGPSSCPPEAGGASSATCASAQQTSSSARRHQQGGISSTPPGSPVHEHPTPASDAPPKNTLSSTDHSPSASGSPDVMSEGTGGESEVPVSTPSASAMSEPNLHPGQHARLSQNVRMSRGCYGDIHSMDGSLWDTPASSSSGNQSTAQLGGHDDEPLVPTPGSAQSSGEHQGPIGMERPRRPHSTSSSDEWLRNQAGSSSTSRTNSHRSFSEGSQGSDEAHPVSGESPVSVETSSSSPSSRAASSPEAQASAVSRHTASAVSDAQAESAMSPQSSTEDQSAGSVGVASLSAGVASRLPSHSQTSSAASQEKVQQDRQEHGSSVLSSIQDHAIGSPMQAVDGSVQSHGPSGTCLPRSASMDVEVGSLGGDWAQDAQTLGLNPPDMQPHLDDRTQQPATPSAMPSSASAAEAIVTNSSADIAAQQLTPGYHAGASPSFELGFGAAQQQSEDIPPTPQFQAFGGSAGSPQEQATPQMSRFARVEHAPTAPPQQPLASYSSLESDAATPPPRVLPQPIQVAAAVTSKVQISMGRQQAEDLLQDQSRLRRSAAQSTATIGEIGAAVPHAGDLMSPPMMCTPVMPRGHPSDKPKPASKRASNDGAEADTASGMAQQSGNGKPAIGQIAACNASKASSIFLTTPPPPTVPKVSSRTRKRSPRFRSSAATQPSGSAAEPPQGLIGQIQGVTPSMTQTQPSAQPAAPQPSRKPAGPSSAAKPPLPSSRKQRGPRMSRFAPQGARPAVQTAAVHAELGIPAVVPPPHSSQMAPASTSSTAALNASAAAAAGPMAQSVEQQPGSILATDNPDRVGSGTETSSVVEEVSDLGNQPLREVASTSLSQVRPEAAMTTPLVMGYASRQFEHPGMTPFPGPGTIRAQGAAAINDGSDVNSVADEGADEPLPEPQLPSLGPPGHTPFPRKMDASTTSPDSLSSSAPQQQIANPATGIVTSGLEQLMPAQQSGAAAHAEEGKGAVAAVPLHMLMQHLQGGLYDSPTANRPLKFVADSPPDSSPTTPPAQVSAGRWLVGPQSPPDALRAGDENSIHSEGVSFQLPGSPATGNAGTPTVQQTTHSPARTPVSPGRGSLDSWLRQTGLAPVVASPARSNLQALWAKAAEAKLLQAALEEAAEPPLATQPAEQANGSSLEAENAHLRAELENVQADLAYVRDSRIFPQQQPISEQALVAHTDAVAAKDAAEQMRQMAENAETVAFIFEAEKKALAEELDLALRRLAEAESAKRVEGARPGTPAKRLAQLQSQLDSARVVADAANKAVDEAALVADAARADKVAAKQEVQDLRQQLTEQLSAACRGTMSQDATIHDLYSQLEEALAALQQPRQQASTDQILDAQDKAEAAPDSQEAAVGEVVQLQDTSERQSHEDLQAQLAQAWEQASLMEEMWTEENAQLRAALEAAHEELQAALEHEEAASSAAGSPQGESLPQAQEPAGGSNAAVGTQVGASPTEGQESVLAAVTSPASKRETPGPPPLTTDSSHTPAHRAAACLADPTPTSAALGSPSDSEVDSPTGRGVQRLARSGIVSRSLAGGKWTPHIRDADEMISSTGRRSAPGTAQSNPVQAPKPTFFGPHRFFPGNGGVDVSLGSSASFRQLGKQPLGLQAALSPTISSPVWGQVANRLRQLRGDLDRAQASLGLQAEAAAAAGAGPLLGGRRLEACLDAEDQSDPAASPPSPAKSPSNLASILPAQETQRNGKEGMHGATGGAETASTITGDIVDESSPSSRGAEWVTAVQQKMAHVMSLASPAPSGTVPTGFKHANQLKNESSSSSPLEPPFQMSPQNGPAMVDTHSASPCSQPSPFAAQDGAEPANPAPRSGTLAWAGAVSSKANESTSRLLDDNAQPAHTLGPFHEFPDSPQECGSRQSEGSEGLIPLGDAPTAAWAQLHRSPTKSIAAGPASWASPARSDASAVSIGPRGSPQQDPRDPTASSSDDEDEPASSGKSSPPHFASFSASAGHDGSDSHAHRLQLGCEPATSAGGSGMSGTDSPTHSTGVLSRAVSGLSEAASISPRTVNRPRTARALLSRLALPGDGADVAFAGAPPAELAFPVHESRQGTQSQSSDVASPSSTQSSAVFATPMAGLAATPSSSWRRPASSMASGSLMDYATPMGTLEPPTPCSATPIAAAASSSSPHIPPGHQQAIAADISAAQGEAADDEQQATATVRSPTSNEGNPEPPRLSTLQLPEDAGASEDASVEASPKAENAVMVRGLETPQQQPRGIYGDSGTALLWCHERIDDDIPAAPLPVSILGPPPIYPVITSPTPARVMSTNSSSKSSPGHIESCNAAVATPVAALQPPAQAQRRASGIDEEDSQAAAASDKTHPTPAGRVGAQGTPGSGEWYRRILRTFDPATPEQPASGRGEYETDAHIPAQPQIMHRLAYACDSASATQPEQETEETLQILQETAVFSPAENNAAESVQPHLSQMASRILQPLQPTLAHAAAEQSPQNRASSPGLEGPELPFSQQGKGQAVSAAQAMQENDAAEQMPHQKATYPASVQGQAEGPGHLTALELPTPGVLQAITNTHSPSPSAGGAGNPWEGAQSPSPSGGDQSGAPTGSWWSSSSASNSFRGPASPGKGQTPSNSSSCRPPRPARQSSGGKTVQSKPPRPVPLTPALSTTGILDLPDSANRQGPDHHTVSQDVSDDSSTLLPSRPAGSSKGAAATGRKQDDAEFRRRAAALGIRISPYFRRP
ncbi:hypothetical protein WJX74_007069 [Apatococcus lobatus]|uniref:Uncharacterized protein n=1 Tax=Apatococcus lobatus TaxID=904363 RepID=A0AAW1RIH4_9CHLO